MNKQEIPMMDIDVLMSRIREEVARRKQLESTQQSSDTNSPPVAESPPITRQARHGTSHARMPDLSPPFVPEKNYVLDDFLVFHDELFVKNAYQGILLREADPGGLENYLTRLRDGLSNKVDILGSLRYSREGRNHAVKVKGLLHRYLWQRATRIPVIGYLLLSLKTLLRTPVLAGNLQHLDAHFHYSLNTLRQYLNNAITETDDSLERLESSLDELNKRINQLEADQKVLLGSRLDEMEERLSGLNEEQNNILNSRMDELRVNIRRLEEEQDILLDSKLDKLEGKISALEEEQGNLRNEHARMRNSERDDKDIRNQLVVQQRLFLEMQRRMDTIRNREKPRYPANEQAQKQVFAGEEDHLLDAFYVSFEDKFRGTREDIKKRSEYYLQAVRDANAGTADAPVLDIGCGRGEWLELLKDNALHARGVEVNRVMIAESRKHGIEVIEAEAGEYLRGLATDSIGAVTAIHVIEHISFRNLIALFDEVVRILRPGGIAIFETPNPENIIVGSCSFYTDPSHIQPLPPEMLKFVLEQRGFADVSIHRLRETESFSDDKSTSTLDADLGRLLYGPRDYAVIGSKL